MGLYNVMYPCVIGTVHHTRATALPIEVDDEVAAPLVESKHLRPFGPRPEEVTDAVVEQVTTAPVQSPAASGGGDKPELTKQRSRPATSGD